MFTVWYMCTPVACDSRYTQSTVRKLTPRPVAVLSGLIDHYHNCASIFLPFDKCSYSTDCFFTSSARRWRTSLEFIEMAPFIRNDCTMTSCTHMWLL